MKVKAIKHLSVYEKIQYYIQFESETHGIEERYTINVGEKTFEKVNQMLNNEIQNTSNALDEHGAATRGIGGNNKGKMGDPKSA